MKEPTIYFYSTGAEVPYSMGTVRQLVWRAQGNVRMADGIAPDPFFDADFRKRYAAILLRERGL